MTTVNGFELGRLGSGALFLGKLLGVELEFLALENVAVAAARLAGSTRDAGVETARGELLLQRRVQHAVLLAEGKLRERKYEWLSSTPFL